MVTCAETGCSCLCRKLVGVNRQVKLSYYVMDVSTFGLLTCTAASCVGERSSLVGLLLGVSEDRSIIVCEF